MTRKPQREGYILAEEGENLYSDWLDMGGCCCHTGCAPCSSCVSEWNPISLEEGDEYWEVDIDQWVLDYPTEPEFTVEDFLHQGWTYPQMITSMYLKLKQEVKMARGNIVNKSNVKDPPEFKVGKWYKCKWAGFSLLIEGKYYLCQGKGNGGFTNGGVSYGDSCFDVNSECCFDPITEVSVDRGTQLYYDSTGTVIVPKEYEGIDLSKYPVRENVFKQDPKYNFDVNFNQQEESKMTNRKIVNVTLIDNDPALDVQYSVVAQFDNLVTEDSTDVLIQEILMNPEFDVAGKIKEHNETRSKQVDLAIEKNTGNSVKLKPVKLKQLTWSVK